MIKSRKRVVVFCFIIVIVFVVLTGCTKKENDKYRDVISVYLWSTDLMNEYAPYIQSQLPDIEIQFVVGNNDLNFYEFMKENGNLPDIITNRRFSLKDAESLQQNLMDLSGTEEAGSIYLAYLDNYTNNDGTVNWLPICGEVDGFVANKKLFDKYGIPLPTDYNSFVAACKMFEENGIRGFASDFVYDYTCMEILQGLSISELTTMEGMDWRHQYERTPGVQTGLDDTIWPGVFERMEQFIDDVGIKNEDVNIEYDDIVNMFLNEEVAIIRETGTKVVEYASSENVDPVMLPYFGKDDEKWLLTYPSFHVALNKELENEPSRKEKALKVLNVMLSEEAQNILAQKRDILSYSKNVNLELSEYLDNLKPYIEENHIYVRMASNDFFSASKEVVQKMISKEYDAQQAYTVFDEKLKETKEDAENTVVSLDGGYSYKFQKDKGNQSSSAMVNTLLEYFNCDALIAPAYSFTGSLMKADYTEKMIGYMIMPNILEVWKRDMTGKELKECIRVSIEGSGNAFTPFNMSSLPTIGGIHMDVEENSGKFILKNVTKNGRKIEDNEIYSVVYLNTTQFQKQLAEQLYPEESLEAFQKDDKMLRIIWTEYLKNGGKIEKPSDYITLK